MKARSEEEIRDLIKERFPVDCQNMAQTGDERDVMRLTPNLETTTMGCEVGWDSISPEPVEVTGGERATLAEPLYSHVDRSIEFTQYSRNAWDVPRDGEWVHALPKLLRSHWPTSRPRLSGLPHPRLERSPLCPLHPRMLNGGRRLCQPPENLPCLITVPAHHHCPDGSGGLPIRAFSSQGPRDGKESCDRTTGAV